jgi:Ca-activated chloride channel family protein
MTRVVAGAELVSAFQSGSRKPHRDLRNVRKGCWLLLALLAIAQRLPAAAQDGAAAAAPGGAELLGPPQRLRDVTRGSLLLETVSPGVYLPAPLLLTEVELVVRGVVARAAIRQRFTNPTVQWVEGIYVFPLPERAAVDGLELVIGDRRIVGEIAEREEARRAYETAKREGRKAALLDQERPNVFTTAVANLGPGEMVDVVLRYQQEVPFDGSGFELRFPLVVAPRYVPGAPSKDPPTGTGWARDTDEAPDASHVTPRVLAPQADPAAGLRGEPVGTLNPVRLQVDLDAGLPLERLASLAHAMHTERVAGTRWRLSLAQRKVPADRDFVLRWQPAASGGPRPTLLTEPATGGGVHALLLVLPPAGETAPARVPRETIYVIDTSGSMSGESMKQARAALLQALEHLAPEDRFNIVDFDSTARALFPSSKPCDMETLEEARRWVADLRADGGTEMLTALRLALTGEPERDRLRQVIFLTDGSVANERAILDYLAAELGETRLFTVAIGSAPNSWFLAKAAELGRGSFTHISDPGEAAARIGELYRRLESPLARDLEVVWDDPNADAWPRELPDLYAGEPLVVAAWLPGNGGALVRGVVGDEPWQARLEPQPAPEGSGLDKLWAHRQVTALTDGLHRGADPQEVRRAVIEVALAHRLVTRWTSLVAVDVTPTAPAGQLPASRPLPVNLPAGWEAEAVFGRLPQTATPARLLLLFGLVGFAAAFLVARGGGR